MAATNDVHSPASGCAGAADSLRRRHGGPAEDAASVSMSPLGMETSAKRVRTLLYGYEDPAILYLTTPQARRAGERRHREAAWIMLAIVMWPFSLLLLPMCIGIARTRILLDNLSLLGWRRTHASPAAAPEDNPAPVVGARRGTFLFHTLPTILYTIAAVCWIVELSIKGFFYSAEDTRRHPAAAALHVMMHFQMLSTLIGLVSRRFACATQLASNADLFARSPTLEQVPSAFMNARDVAMHGFTSYGAIVSAAMNLSDNMGTPRTSVLLDERAYTNVRWYTQRCGGADLPPLNFVRKLPAASLRTPSGRTILAARCDDDTMPPSRDHSHYAGKLADFHDDEIADAAYSKLVLMDGFATQLMTDGRSLLSIRKIIKMLLLAFIASVIGCALPFIVRAALRLPVWGVSPLQTAVLVLLPCCELACIVLVPAIAGVLNSFLVYASAANFAHVMSTEREPIALRDAQVDAVPEQADAPSDEWQVLCTDFQRLSHGAEPFTNVFAHSAELEAAWARIRRGCQPLLSLQAARITTLHARMQLHMVGDSVTGRAGAAGGLPSLLILAASVIFTVTVTVLPNSTRGVPEHALDSLRQAAIAPASVGALSFVINTLLLLFAFLRLRRYLRHLRNLHRLITWWHMDAVAASQYAIHNKELALQELAVAESASGCASAEARAAAARVQVADSRLAYMRALAEELRGAEALFADALGIQSSGHGMPIRFLGIVEPSRLSLGGLLVAAISAAGLGIRLASRAY